MSTTHTYRGIIMTIQAAVNTKIDLAEEYTKRLFQKAHNIVDGSGYMPREHPELVAAAINSMAIILATMPNEKRGQ